MQEGRMMRMGKVRRQLPTTARPRRLRDRKCKQRRMYLTRSLLKGITSLVVLTQHRCRLQCVQYSKWTAESWRVHGDHACRISIEASQASDHGYRGISGPVFTGAVHSSASALTHNNAHPTLTPDRIHQAVWAAGDKCSCLYAADGQYVSDFIRGRLPVRLSASV